MQLEDMVNYKYFGEFLHHVSDDFNNNNHLDFSIDFLREATVFRRGHDSEFWSQISNLATFINECQDPRELKQVRAAILRFNAEPKNYEIYSKVNRISILLDKRLAYLSNPSRLPNHFKLDQWLIKNSEFLNTKETSFSLWLNHLEWSRMCQVSKVFNQFLNLEKNRIGFKHPLLNPVNHFTSYAKIIGSEAIKTAFEFINKNNIIYEVGSGNGAVALFFEQHGFKMICIDPDPNSYEKGQVLKQPEYNYLRDIPIIEENASLLLVAPDPRGYDLEAIIHHDWKQIILITEITGTSLSSGARSWLERGIINLDEDNQEGYPDTRTYGRVYTHSIRVKVLDKANLKEAIKRTFEYCIIILEKDYTKDTIWVERELGSPVNFFGHSFKYAKEVSNALGSH